MLYLFLADGFEEIEALATLDILRRAEMDVQTVGIQKLRVTGAHGLKVEADLLDIMAVTEGLEGIILPGGMPGTLNLEQSSVVQSFLEKAWEQKLLIAAICAAPSILGHKNLLKGIEAVCFPGYEQEMTGARLSSQSVCNDRGIITAKGAGVSLEFGLEIVAQLKSRSLAEKIKAAMQCRG